MEELQRELAESRLREERLWQEVKRLQCHNGELRDEVSLLKLKLTSAAIDFQSPEPQPSWMHHHILHDLLRRLPTLDLIRGRSVCKHWESTISHNSHFTTLHQPDSWIILNNPSSPSPDSQRVWVARGENVEGESEFFPCKVLLEPSYCKGDFKVMAACKGLVCGRLTTVFDSVVLAVGNPLFESSWKQLPAAPFSEFWLEKVEDNAMAVEMVVDEETGCYKVLLLAHAYTHFTGYSGVKWIDEYDSRKNKWRPTGWYAGYSWSSNLGRRVTGSFAVFGVVKLGVGLHMENLDVNLAVFDIGTGEWSEVRTEFVVPSRLRFTSVVDCRVVLYEGSYVLASALLNDEDCLLGFGIWKLEEVQPPPPSPPPRGVYDEDDEDVEEVCWWKWKLVSHFGSREFAARGVRARKWKVDDFFLKCLVHGEIVTFFSDKGVCFPVVCYNLRTQLWIVLRESAQAAYSVTCLLEPSFKP